MVVERMPIVLGVIVTVPVFFLSELISWSVFLSFVAARFSVEHVLILIPFVIPIIHPLCAFVAMILWSHRSEKRKTISICILSIALLGLLSNCLLRSYVLEAFARMLSTMHPPIILTIPCSIYWVLLAIVGIPLVVKERLMNNKSVTSSINVACVLFNIIVAGVSVGLSILT